jgi:hypothetical protein
MAGRGTYVVHDGLGEGATVVSALLWPLRKSEEVVRRRWMSL